MTPIEFTLWLNGAAGVIGPDGPTPEQWARVQSKLTECIGQLVASRLLEEAEDVYKRKTEEEKRKAYNAQLAAQLAAMRAQSQSQMSKMLAGTIDDLALKSLMGSGISAPFGAGSITLSMGAPDLPELALPDAPTLEWTAAKPTK